MIYSRNYARMFVTLKQESSDYSSDFREAMGRCVIEVRFGKGRFSAYIQGLKSGNYSLLFISCKNGNNIGVDIGKIQTDSTGKGEFKTEFDPENVYGTNLKIEDFHVVAVTPFLSRTNKALLTGYINSVVQWKEGFSFFENKITKPIKSEPVESIDTTKPEPIEPITEPAEETITEPIELIETAEPKSTESTETIEDKPIKREFTETVKDEVAETLENETSKIQSLNNSFEKINKAEQNFNDIIKKFKQGIEKIEEQEKRQKISTKNSEKISSNIQNRNYGVDYIFENNTKMTPFEHQQKDILWIRIDLSELIILPGRMWLYLNNPFVSFSEKKYKHLILGKFIESGKENYILGVPGRYFSDYRLEAGLQGFKQFKCCENKLPAEGDYGYWLLNIPKIINN